MTIDISGASAVLTVVGLAAFALLQRHFLSSYFGEKGRNVATREDIARVTQLAQDIQARLSQGETVHNVQFEAEFRSLQDLWEAAHRAVAAYQNLWFISAADESNENEFFGAQLSFTEMLARCEPFTPPLVWEKFEVLEGQISRAKDLIMLNEPISDETKTKLKEAIDAAEDACSKGIRQRLASALVVSK